MPALMLPPCHFYERPLFAQFVSLNYFLSFILYIFISPLVIYFARTRISPEASFSTTPPFSRLFLFIAFHYERILRYLMLSLAPRYATSIILLPIHFRRHSRCRHSLSIASTTHSHGHAYYSRRSGRAAAKLRLYSRDIFIAARRS